MTDREERDTVSPHVELARAAIEAWVKGHRTLSDEEKSGRGGLDKEKAAAFVSLKKGGALRGCIGTFEPMHASLADEIASNAISAASRDPRFPPIEQDELPQLDISVDVLGAPEAVPDSSYLDPRNYGVIVRSGNRVGLLLPDLEGVDTVEEQVDIARSKAGIGRGEPVQLYRFTVQRFH
jgi:AmmeMemoRadiSam system protein A